MCYEGKYCRIRPTLPLPITTPKPPPCKNDYDCPAGYKCKNDNDYDCPAGYKCDYEVCVPVPTSTNTPTPPPPKQCCFTGNRYKNCYWCRPIFTCVDGEYCEYVPSTNTPQTPKPPSCVLHNHCQAGYECKHDVCVPVPTTTTITPTPSKPTYCCFIGNRFMNCYRCQPSFTCVDGVYCEYVPSTTTPTTPKPPTSCVLYNNCPAGYECKNDVCVPVPTTTTITPTTSETRIQTFINLN
ncbi:unnamed protein product [Meloidogyne enterolobii]|uniref:Uncharacterized protein n=1 Tax=Meloidogyne enterolobii TaxID=390850 RepID=A0ACB1AQA1_MELEN